MICFRLFLEDHKYPQHTNICHFKVTGCFPVQVERYASTHFQQRKNSLQNGKLVPAVGALRSEHETGAVCSAVQIPGGPASIERPVPPPAHVIAQVQAWQTQEQLYRGAVCPCVASDDPQPARTNLQSSEHIGDSPRDEKPCHDGQASSAVSCGPAAQLLFDAVCSDGDKARGSLLRHCVLRRPSQFLSAVHEGVPDTNAALGPNATKAVYLDRVAGGGVGLPGAPPHHQSQCIEAMQDVTNTGQANSQLQTGVYSSTEPESACNTEFTRSAPSICRAHHQDWGLATT